MPLRRALIVWFMLIMAESAHGVMRIQLLAPLVGDFAARQWGVLSGSLLILFIAWLMAPWMWGAASTTAPATATPTSAPSAAACARVGIMWVVLTLAMEVWMGMALGLSRERMLEDYNLAEGGMLGLGMLFLGFAPWLGAKLRRLKPAAA